MGTLGLFWALSGSVEPCPSLLGSVGLCRALSASVRLCRAPSRPVGLSQALSSFVRLFWPLSSSAGLSWLCRALSSPFELSVSVEPLLCSVGLSRALLSPVALCQALLGSVGLCQALSPGPPCLSSLGATRSPDDPRTGLYVPLLWRDSQVDQLLFFMHRCEIKGILGKSPD